MACTLRAFGRVDPEFVVNTFVDSLSDPHQPKHCAQFYVGCIISLSHRDVGWQNITALREGYPQYYDACVRFITVTRSEEENARLEKDMEICSCDLSNRQIESIHNIGARYGYDSTYKEVGKRCAGEVHNALQPVREAGNLHKVSRNQERAAREGKSLPWPATPADLLPFGPDASIAAIGVWVELVPFTIWLGLLASMLDIFKQQLIGPILRNPTLPGKIVGIGEIPWITWCALDADGPRVGNGTYTKVHVAADVKRAAALCNMFACYGSDDDVLTLNRRADAQFGRDLLSLCQIAVQNLPALARSVARHPVAAADCATSLEKFLIVGAWLHHKLDLPYDEQKYGKLIVLNSLNRRKMESSPAFTAYEALLALWYAERCWGPGCAETFVSAQRKFSACSGCKRVTYCSKTCQTAAWKDEALPHKAVCRKLRDVSEATALPAKPRAEDKLVFQATCEAKKVDESALIDITVYVKQLLKRISSANEIDGEN